MHATSSKPLDESSSRRRDPATAIPSVVPAMPGVAWAWLAAGLFLSSAGSLTAEEILILRSSDATPYRNAAAQANLLITSKSNHKCINVNLSAASDRIIMSTLRKVRLCVAIGSPAAKALHKHLTDRNIMVYCMVSDPDQIGIQPGRQVFEIAVNIPITSQLDLIRKTLPNARSIGMLYDSRDANSRRIHDRVSRSLPSGFKLQSEDISRHDSVAQALHVLIRKGIDVLWTAPDRSVFGNQSVVRAVINMCLRRRKPVYGFSLDVIRSGGMLGLVLDAKVQGTQSGEVGLKLIETLETSPGVDPTTKIPGSTPPRHEIAINMQIARFLRIRRIPNEVLNNARHRLGDLQKP